MLVAVAAYLWALPASFATGGGTGGSSSNYNYGKKVAMCHNGKKTIHVSQSAVPEHLAEGDTLGPCP